jgi:toxin YoeB
LSVRKLIFEGDTWQNYEKLRETNKPAHKSLIKILKDMQRGDPSVGLGKPERLRHNLAGLWSRRFTSGDRLIYIYDDESIRILAIGGHYDRR